MQEFDVQPNAHSLYIRAREDGTKIRAVSFAQRGTCGWAPQLLLPRTIATTWGRVVAPMIVQDDYVYVPNEGTTYSDGTTTCHPDRPQDHCGMLQHHFSCAGPSEIDFEVDVEAAQDENQIYIAVNSAEWQPGDPYPTFYAAVTLQRTPTGGPTCDAVNGIRGGDVCCPAECGSCGGSGCGSRVPGLYVVPGDPTSGSACCSGAISRSERTCDADARILAPCVSPDSFRWRPVGGGVRGAQMFVEGGEHTLEIFHRKAGTKIRNIRFTDRGSCGFTDSSPTDPALVATETAMCQVRLQSLATTCPGGTPLPGLLAVSLPRVCMSDCASDFISFHADCRQLLQTDSVPGTALHALDMFLDSCNSAPPSPPEVPPLTTEQCTAQFANLVSDSTTSTQQLICARLCILGCFNLLHVRPQNVACCTPAKYCTSGVPSRCASTCVDPFLSLYRDCYPTLQAVQNVVRCLPALLLRLSPHSHPMLREW